MKRIFLKITLLFMLFSFSSNFYAQEDIEVLIGEEIRSYRKETIASVHRGDDGIIVLKGKYSLLGRPDYYLEIFDNNMNFVSRNEIDLPDRDIEFSEMTYLNGKIYFFMEKYDKKSKINYIYGTILSKDGKFEKDIFEITQFEVEKRRKTNDFFTDISADSSKFVIMVSPPEIGKEQKAKRQFIVLDLDFNEVDNIELDFPFLERDFRVARSHMDPMGNIHMLCEIAIEESKRSSFFRNEEREARVFTLYKGATAVEEYKINFLNEDAGFISQIKMKTDKLGRLQCAGFYSDRKGNSTKGVFVFTIDPSTKEISNVSSQEFTDEYLNQFLSDRQVRKKDRKRSKNKEKNPYERLYYYKVRDLVMKEGGGFYMVAEFYLHTTTTTTDANGNTRVTHHYRYNDLMVINVLEDNSISWFSRVPKYQYTTNDNGYYSGIVMGLNNDNSLNILFNDDRDNANVVDHDNKGKMKYKRIRTVLVKFDNDGNATKTPLINAKKSSALLVPGLSPKGKSNDIILYSNLKKKNRFINVKLR
jgi:hypothetical protein